MTFLAKKQMLQCDKKLNNSISYYQFKAMMSDQGIL